MKLATLKTKEIDGELIIVSRDLTRAVSAKNIAPTLQFAIDHWRDCQPQLNALYQQLNDQQLQECFPFDAEKVASPLPRAYQWADGSAYVNHVELMRKGRGVQMLENFWTDPLMYQGGSDSFIGPCDNIEVISEDFGIDFETEVAIITDHVPMGVSVEDAAQYIQLVMLVNDVSLRNLIADELIKGFGFFQSKPASSFSPVALTLDELRDAWHDNKIHLPLVSHLNNQLFGKPNAGIDMTFDFAQLIAHAAKTRHLAAGTIIGSGTVSNLDRSAGSGCIAEKRMLEVLADGKATTPFMHFGDRIRIEMFTDNGMSLFGAIDQEVVRYSCNN